MVGSTTLSVVKADRRRRRSRIFYGGRNDKIRRTCQRSNSPFVAAKAVAAVVSFGGTDFCARLFALLLKPAPVFFYLTQLEASDNVP